MVLVVIIAIPTCLLLALREVGAWGTRIHMRSVTRSLAEWAIEYGKIQDDQQAERAIGMLGYARDYYILCEGYRGDSRTEAALEAQRAQTLAAIAAGLRRYTGRDFGVDDDQWLKWWQSEHGVDRSEPQLR